MTQQEFAEALAAFRSRETDPRLRPDPYYLRQVAREARTTFSVQHLDPGFAARLREAIVDGLYWLDAVPRGDPFWADTNRRPTLSKLFDLAGQAVRQRPTEERACWAYAAVSLSYCCNDFGLPGWQGLHDLRRLEAAWPVEAAFHVYCCSGVVTSPALAGFLAGKGLSVAARNALEALEARNGGQSGGWVEYAARSCPVALDPAWLAWNGGLVRGLAEAIRRDPAGGQLPVLADALEEAGCSDEEILRHLREPGLHVRGCWVLDLLLGKGTAPPESSTGVYDPQAARVHEPETPGVVRFRPSRAEGLPDVREVIVRPDRLVVNTAGRWVTFLFRRIGRRQESRVMSFVKRLIGRHPWRVMVADRDWFHPPRDRFFLWYTDPPLRTCMPEDEPADHASSYFARIQAVLGEGGYATFDLG